MRKLLLQLIPAPLKGSKGMNTVKETLGNLASAEFPLGVRFETKDPWVSQSCAIPSEGAASVARRLRARCPGCTVRAARLLRGMVGWVAIEVVCQDGSFWAIL
jgi:hypothetical protein